MRITLHIKVKPYTLKYLNLHLGINYKLSKLDAFGLHLGNLMRRPLDDTRYDKFLSRYTKDFAFDITRENWLSDGYKITPQGQVDFNSFCEAIIKAEFHAFVDFSRSFGVRQAKAIESFRTKYDFQDEDITYETLKKSYQRYCIRSKSRQLVAA